VTATLDFTSKLSRVAVANLEHSIGNPVNPRMVAAIQSAKGLVNLGSGTPDLPTPEHVMDAMREGLRGGVIQYTPYDGIAPLREAIAQKLRLENHLEYTADHIIVTNGAQEAIYVMCAALLNPGDEVIVTNPYYSAYCNIVALCGGVAVTVPVTPESGWSWDLEALEAAVTKRTKLVIVVSPDNPTGAVVSKATMEGIARLAEKHDFLVVSDELYEKYIYDGAEHFSFARLPGMMERTITVNGFSKSYGMTGWRVGYLAVPAWLKQVATETRHMHSISSPVPTQLGALAALTGPQEDWLERLRTYAERRAYLLQRLEGMRLPFVRTQGSYYVMADIRSSGMDSMSFSSSLIEEHAVRVGPGAVFGSGAEGFVRLSLMTPRPAMDGALDKLEAFWQRFA
jgi:aspartate/methionine/tyrosine aminotransferase